MSWSTSRGTFSAYFTASPNLLYSNKNDNQVEIDPLFAAAIEVHDNQQVKIARCLFVRFFLFKGMYICADACSLLLGVCSNGKG